MEAQLQTHVAFHLTGKRPAAGLDAVEGLELRPALLARYRDLTKLRYDFPVILVRGGAGDGEVRALSGLIDALLHEIARGDDAPRVSQHVLRLEQQIRTLVAAGATGSLSTLWDSAAEQLGFRADEPLQTSLERARAALSVDGEVLDCNAQLPARLLRHAWAAVQERKTRRVRDDVDRLIQKLSDILKADFVRSEAGLSEESLKASFGTTHSELFDFAAMSRVLARVSPRAGLPEGRRQRIRWLLSVLEGQRFFGLSAALGGAAQSYSFVFESCASALEAFRQRLPKLTELAKAIAMAELEIAGEYKEANHDAFFEEFGADSLKPEDVALFPDYLVHVNARDLDAIEHAALMEVLSAGLPMKLLLQTDDILDESQVGDVHFGFGVRSRQLTHMAMGLNEVYVVQSSASNLYQCRAAITKGLVYHGPALFSVFSGASGTTGDLPPYLVAAAAMESRAFPAFVYDPSAGTDWASRFDLSTNGQLDADWAAHGFAYEDDAHQRMQQDLAFTVVDFIACDQRHARHFARVPRAKWSANMLPAGEYLAGDPAGVPDKLPCLLMVDSDSVLQRVLVDDRLLREARRCRDAWHSLQELGGIHNSHAERLLARERDAWQEREREQTARREPEAKPDASIAAASSAAVEAAPEKPSDEAYIETPRCTSCNECTNINDKMFAYNENKQAYIANLDAGTYAQLVEAAESCQVSIIHPGKPRNANEPGLDDLIRRAESFR